MHVQLKCAWLNRPTLKHLFKPISECAGGTACILPTGEVKHFSQAYASIASNSAESQPGSPQRSFSEGFPQACA